MGKTLSKEELAKRLHGTCFDTDYRTIIKGAKENNLLVIEGYSDDIVMFSGVFNDEIGAYEGVSFWLYYQKDVNEWGISGDKIENATKIEAVWLPKYQTTKELENASWLIRTDAPHSTFDTFEDGATFCRGIVIDLDELKKVADLVPPQKFKLPSNHVTVVDFLKSYKGSIEELEQRNFLFYHVHCVSGEVDLSNAFVGGFVDDSGEEPTIVTLSVWNNRDNCVVWFNVLINESEDYLSSHRLHLIELICDN